MCLIIIPASPIAAITEALIKYTVYYNDTWWCWSNGINYWFIIANSTVQLWSLFSESQVASNFHSISILGNQQRPELGSI